MGIEPGKISILNLFETSDIYDIPSYQRDYKWTTKEVSTLISDLIAFGEELESNTSTEQLVYYVGGIIRQKTPSGTKESTNADYYLIDGQQRITTFYLLYKYLLQKKIINRGITEEETLHKHQIEAYNRYFKKSDKQFKLRNNNNNLEKFIYGSDETAEGVQKYKENYEVIKSLLANKLETDEDIERWEKILSETVISFIEPTQNQNAEQLFENINSKGKELSGTELFKNKLLLTNNLVMKGVSNFDPGNSLNYKMMNEDLESRIISAFNEIDNFTNWKHKLYIKSDDELLRIIICSLFSIETENDALSQYKDNVKPVLDSYSNFDELEDLMKSLEDIIRSLKVMGSISSWESKAWFYVSWMNKKSNALLSLVIKLLINNDIKIYSEDTNTTIIDKEIHNLFKLLVRINILTDGYYGVNMWRLIPKTLDEFTSIDKLQDKMEEIFNNEEGEEEEVKIKNFGSVTNNEIASFDFYKREKQLTKHLLLNVEYNLQQDSVVSEKLEWETVVKNSLNNEWTIEHIIPQTINNSNNDGKKWISDLGDWNYTANIDKIGNLSIANFKLNASMRNYEFTKKKELLKERSIFELSKKIVEFGDKFTENEFISRSEFMANEIQKIIG